MQAEPLPPPGTSEEALLKAFVAAVGGDQALELWRWFRVEWPGWARDHWKRLKAVHDACTAAGGKPSG